MASKSDVVVLHGIYAEWSRTLKSGKVKQRITIQTDATPILHLFDEEALGAGPAQAITEAYQAGIKGIRSFITGATKDRRERHVKNPNTRSYKKRFMGGKTGHTPPKPHAIRWGNDSGRLADGITTRHVPSQKAFITNVPANRLFRETFGPGFDAFLAELVRRAPVLGNARLLANRPEVKAAIAKSKDVLFAKLERANASKIRSLTMARLRLAKQVLGGLAQLAA